MTKIKFAASFLLSFCIFLCGCTSNYTKDVHFIHAVSFDINKDDDTREILAVCEKQSGDKDNSKKEQEYFVCHQKAKSFEDALDKLTKKYSSSYYASNTLYLLPEDIDHKALEEISVFISQSNVMPSKAAAVLISNTTPYELLNTIKNQEDIKKLLKLLGKKKTNIVHFLANSQNKKFRNKITHLTLSENKKDIKVHKND